MQKVSLVIAILIAINVPVFAQNKKMPDGGVPVEQTSPSKPTSANATDAKVVPQPKSNLGKQVPTTAQHAQQNVQQKPEAAMPKARALVQESINELEESQLTDAQYERIKKIYLRRERQKAMPYVVTAKPITRTLMVNLDPGVSPPILRVSRGQLTSIVFSDISGQPWIIKDVSLNRQIFSDGRADAGGGLTEPTNVLTLEPLTAAAFGNVSVKLKGLPTPVIFVLAAAQQEVDLRVDAKVPGRNPDSLDTVNYTSMPTIDVSLTAFLDGVPPKESRRLRVTGLANTEAWMYQDNLYVRTDADVQYPAYYSAARSTSGKATYRFNARQNSITLLSNGRAATVFIED